MGGRQLSFAAWRSATGAAATETAVAGLPSSPTVLVRLSQWDPGRATVVVYNWSRAASVPVDLSALLNAVLLWMAERGELPNDSDWMLLIATHLIVDS